MNLLTKKHVFVLICLLVSIGGIVGCGKKPSDIKAPPHVTKDAYPQIYPAPAPLPKN